MKEIAAFLASATALLLAASAFLDALRKLLRRIPKHGRSSKRRRKRGWSLCLLSLWLALSWSWLFSRR